MAEKHTDLVSNKKASFNYEILDTLESGIALQGTEIKSLRNHGGTLQDAFVKILDGEAWLYNCHIAPYTFGNIHNHEPKRDRKLLLHKREIAKLHGSIQEKGLTVIPLALYFKDGRIKVRLAVCRGKKSHDKRAAIKERDEIKEVKKSMKRLI